MEAERWRGQLRLLAACIAVAASVSYGAHLFFERRRRDVLRQLIDAQLRLKRELDELRAQVQQLGATSQTAPATSSPGSGSTGGTPRVSGSKSDNIALTPTGPTRRAILHGTITTKEQDSTHIKSDDEEFFEFSEC